MPTFPFSESMSEHFFMAAPYGQECRLECSPGLCPTSNSCDPPSRPCPVSVGTLCHISDKGPKFPSERRQTTECKRASRSGTVVATEHSKARRFRVMGRD